MTSGTTQATHLRDEEKHPAIPDPFSEIRLTSLSATRGANFWSTKPITRMDLVVGEFENISSADTATFTERLVSALPGLEEHRCSIGERGGFITRLNRGTYAPHIIEHVALELQFLVGHDVGYGRTRGGDVEGEYTVVMEHLHEATGMRAAALALDVVQQTFSGLTPGVDHVLAELRMLAATPDVPPLTPEVTCGLSGGSNRAELRSEIARRLDGSDELLIDVSPGFLLQAGLPYAKSRVAIVLDTDLTDVPDRYREPERAHRLMSVMGDAVPRGGLLIVPAKAWDIQDHARQIGCAVAVFSGANDITRKDKKVARSAAWVADDTVVLEHLGRLLTREPLRDDVPPHVQAAAALAQLTLRS